MIVMKFGGTSLQSADAIRQAISIIRSRMALRPIVIVSALGKVTDKLLALATETAHGNRQEASKGLAELERYHRELAAALIQGDEQEEVTVFLNEQFGELQLVLDRLRDSGHLTAADQDAVTSFGERLSSGIVAIALRSLAIPSIHLDARALVCTDGRHAHAVPLVSKTYLKIRNAMQHVPQDTVPVMGGFIGRSASGATTTLGRNSSNLTAVLAAAAVGADEVEMWTDVDGVFRHDPRDVPDQRPEETLSFAEAVEIAHRGARVLHAEAVQLAAEECITLHIRNSRDPALPGTRISGTILRATTTDSYLGAATSDCSR
jgi:aspartate kinase